MALGARTFGNRAFGDSTNSLEFVAATATPTTVASSSAVGSTTLVGTFPAIAVATTTSVGLAAIGGNTLLPVTAVTTTSAVGAIVVRKTALVAASTVATAIAMAPPVMPMNGAAYDEAVLGLDPFLYFNWDTPNPDWVAEGYQMDLGTEDFDPAETVASEKRLDRSIYPWLGSAPFTLTGTDRPAINRSTRIQTTSPTNYGWQAVNNTTFINSVRDEWPSDIVEEYSFAVWYRPAALVGTTQWLCRFSPNGMGLYYLNATGTLGELVGMHYADDTGYWNRIGFYNGDEINRWNFAVFTASADFLRLYHNGTKISEYDADGGAGAFGFVDMPNLGFTRFQIGFESSVTEAFRGAIGPVAVWNRQLTGDEVEELFAAANPSSDVATALRLRAVERRARADHIIMKPEPETPPPHDLMLTVQDVGSVADSYIASGTFQKINDTLILQSGSTPPGGDPFSSWEIDTTGDVFTADFVTPVASAAGGQLTYAYSSAQLGSTWFVYGGPDAVAAVAQPQEFLPYTLTDDDPVTVTSPSSALTPLPSAPVLNSFNTSNLLVALDDTNMAVIRPDPTDANAPRLHIVRWDGSTLTTRTSTTFGAQAPYGSWGRYMVGNTMLMKKISSTQLLIVWRDDNDYDWTDSDADGFMFAQVVTFNTDTGALTPHTRVRLRHDMRYIDDHIYWDDQRLLILAGFDGDYLGYHTQSIHIDGTTPVDLDTNTTLFLGDEGNVTYTGIFVGQDGVYAVIYSVQKAGAPEYEADVLYKKFTVGTLPRNLGAVQVYEEGLLRAAVSGEYEIDAHMTWSQGPFQWSANKTIAMYETYNDDDSIYRMVVAEKV